jgi:hypothetical protein
MKNRADKQFSLDNIGFSENFLELFENKEKLFCVKQDKLKKNFSDGAVFKFEEQEEGIMEYNETEDKDLYQEAENIYDHFQELNRNDSYR